MNNITTFMSLYLLAKRNIQNQVEKMTYTWYTPLLKALSQAENRLQGENEKQNETMNQYGGSNGTNIG